MVSTFNNIPVQVLIIRPCRYLGTNGEMLLGHIYMYIFIYVLGTCTDVHCITMSQSSKTGQDLIEEAFGDSALVWSNTDFTLIRYVGIHLNTSILKYIDMNQMRNKHDMFILSWQKDLDT